MIVRAGLQEQNRLECSWSLDAGVALWTVARSQAKTFRDSRVHGQALAIALMDYYGHRATTAEEGVSVRCYSQIATWTAH